jgi:hypothetical protein
VFRTVAEAKFPLRAFNSFGEWSTIGKIRELELERENDFPDLSAHPDNTPAIWVTKTRRRALRYTQGASEWDRIGHGGPLTGEETRIMRALVPIDLLPTDLIVEYDGEGGWLIVRPGPPVKRE